MKQPAAWVIPVLFALANVGCQREHGGYYGKRVDVYPVVGTATFAGQPIEDAMIWFHPVDSPHPTTVRPRATVEPDGSYRVTTFEANDGAPPGKYEVTVSWLGPLKGVKEDQEDSLPERLPRRYQNPAQSGIEVEFVEGDNELPPFELTR